MRSVKLRADLCFLTKNAVIDWFCVPRHRTAKQYPQSHIYFINLPFQYSHTLELVTAPRPMTAGFFPTETSSK